MATRFTPSGPQSVASPFDSKSGGSSPTSTANQDNVKKKCPEGYRWDAKQNRCVKIPEPEKTEEKPKPGTYDPETKTRTLTEEQEANIGRTTNYSYRGYDDLSKEEYGALTGRDGIVTPRVKEILQKQKETQGLDFSTIDARNLAELEKTPEEERQEMLNIAEQSGAFEERPERVELDVREGEEAPLTTATKPFGIPKLASNLIKGDTSEAGAKREIEGLMENPETARELMINEIQKEVLNNGATSKQKLGSLLEPFLGDLKVADVDVGRYADLLARMPSQEADAIVEQLKILQGDVSGMTDAASQGEIGNPAEVLRELGNIEVEIAIYEAALKKLVIASDELQANPEEINKIEAELLSTRRDLFEAKQRAAEGALITPLNESLYFRLKELKGG